METGQRKDKDGNPIPRDIINAFTATYAGASVFRATLHPGISANPYIAFHMRVSGPGDLVFTWTDDAGKVVSEKLTLNVTA
jgi:sulfur-oxidizing protein SoxZ